MGNYAGSDNSPENMDGSVRTAQDKTHTPEPVQSGGLASLELLYRWRRFIIINVLGLVVVAALVSLILPKYYRASASVLPPKQQDLFGSISSVASSLAKSIPGASRLGFGQRSAGYNYFAILNSRTAMEEIVRRFDLKSVYEISDSSMEKTLKALGKNVSFEEQTDDYITIEVTDRDPGRAAAMANAFIDVLNTTSTQLGTVEARSNRQFIEQRVNQARMDLHCAEESLKVYQQQNKIAITTEQSASLSGMASLYGLKARREVELGVMEHGSVRDDAAIHDLSLEIGEINKKLEDLPALGLGSLRLYREVLIQQQILEFLLPMLEQAKINEVKDVPVVVILDKAVPPEKRSSPQRLIIVLVTFSLSLFTCIFLVYLLQWLSEFTPRGPFGQELRRLAVSVTRVYRI